MAHENNVHYRRIDQNSRKHAEVDMRSTEPDDLPRLLAEG